MLIKAVTISPDAPPVRARPTTYSVVSVTAFGSAVPDASVPTASPDAIVAPASNLHAPLMATVAACPEAGLFCSTPTGASVAAEQRTALPALRVTNLY